MRVLADCFTARVEGCIARSSCRVEYGAVLLAWHASLEVSLADPIGESCDAHDNMLTHEV